MKVFVLSALEAGADLIHAMIANGVKLDGIIALSPSCDKGNISGYSDAATIADEFDIPVYYVEQYNLKNDTDRNFLEGLEIDLLIVASWQRLVPDWLINHCRRAVLGLHGSAQGINNGRGRSPQNWALICGADSFEIAVFKIDVRVDAGPVLARRRFPYTQHDDIVTSYQKSMLLSADMLTDIILDWDRLSEEAEEQNEETAQYLPQRKPEDGAIDWNLEASFIRSQVAALSRPYPGAYTMLGDEKVFVWSVQPIGDFPLRRMGVAGEIIHISTKRGFIVRVKDGFLAVRDYQLDNEALSALKVGAIFESVPMAINIKNVIERHEARYPDQPLCSDIYNLLESVQ